MEETVHLAGFKELDQKLWSLGEETAWTLMFDAVREGGEVIAVEAQHNAPVRKGILRRDIKVRMGRRKKGPIEAKIGTSKRAWYARLIEFGTAPHKILAAAKVLADKAQGVIYGRTVQHPGTAPHPFLRPALETKRTEVEQTMGRVLWWGITLHAKRKF